MTTLAETDELRTHLLQADPGVLVAVLAQLTGDAAVIDRFGPAISHVPDPPERAGVTDPDTAEALVAAVVDALDGPRPADGLAADDPGKSGTNDGDLQRFRNRHRARQRRVRQPKAALLEQQWNELVVDVGAERQRKNSGEQFRVIGNAGGR